MNSIDICEEEKQELNKKLDNSVINELRRSLNSTLKGKEQVVEYLIVAMLSGGHVLFDDLPGLGKTTLGKAIAKSVGGNFGRLQGTPDLLPSDVTGFSIFDRKTQEFSFRPGPVFSDVLLVDEINRATPRTQSSLFEAMAERQVTVDGKSYALSETFFVIATQNPSGYQGTFELPEAQLDRFSMVLRIGYPEEDAEMAILKEKASQPTIDAGEPPVLMKPNDLHLWQMKVATVFVDEKIQHYLVQIAKSIRSDSEIRSGLSPRGLITLQRVAQANALVNGRDFVTPEDIQFVASPVLGVRIPGPYEKTQEIISRTMENVPCPN